MINSMREKTKNNVLVSHSPVLPFPLHSINQKHTHCPKDQGSLSPVTDSWSFRSSTPAQKLYGSWAPKGQWKGSSKVLGQGCLNCLYLSDVKIGQEFVCVLEDFLHTDV